MSKAPQVVIVTDLGFGDSGKGTTVDFLTRELGAHTVVRFNGGSQAAHNVITPDGRHHTFAQFGSGTFVPGTRTHLSRFMLVDPLNMLAEERHLRELDVNNTFDNTSIEERALIISPFQKAMNKLRELARGGARHGSCGLGIGETMSDFLNHGDKVLFAQDLSCPTTLRRKLSFLKELKMRELAELRDDLDRDPITQLELTVFTDPEIIDICIEVYSHFASQIRIVDENFLAGLLKDGTVIFEGAQGVLLDEWYGFHPFTTWSTTTFANADTLLHEVGYTNQVIKLGVLRAYFTRHGPGPFVTEDPILTNTIPDQHNETNQWQREFRIGHFDLVAARYALEVAGGVDCLAVTNFDQLERTINWQFCHSYNYPDYHSKLGDHFEIKEGTIRKIKLRIPADLMYQEQLTNLLEGCSPNYRTVRRDRETYLTQLSEELEVPIAIVSAGTKASDKTFDSKRFTGKGKGL